MSKKVAVVTGANSGIGFETTVGLAGSGYHVVMACRHQGRADKAKDAILARVPNAGLEVALADIGRFDSVRSFAEGFLSCHDNLDLLVNNAGILDYTGQKNDDGFDLQFATNHLGHFLLTSLLIGSMPDAPGSRVISMSSVAHKKGRIHFDDLTCAGKGQSLSAYAQSKLACLMFADELHRRLSAAGRRVVSVAVHPGGSDSGLFDGRSRLQYYFLKAIAPLIVHSNKAAAESSLYAALSDEVVGGSYFGPRGLMELKGSVGVAKRSDYSRSDEVAARLWDVSEKMVGQKFSIAR